MNPEIQKIIFLTKDEYKDIESFCILNDLEINDVIKQSFLQGYSIEKYGLLSKIGEAQEKRVEIPVEIIKEVVKIEYVEVPVEVIKEVCVEKLVEVIKEVPVEKIVTIYDNSSESELLLKIQQLEQEFSTKTTQMENIFQNEKNELLLKMKQLENQSVNTVEVIKEVIVETQNDNTLRLQNTLQKLRQQIILKDDEIFKMKTKINELNELQQEQKALYLKGSNLDNKLYK